MQATILKKCFVKNTTKVIVRRYQQYPCFLFPFLIRIKKFQCFKVKKLTIYLKKKPNNNPDQYQTIIN